jgi:N-acetylglucosaminyldiphosphoundecaprenol N-acetyl-beta-D-mannosaminyltransferase
MSRILSTRVDPTSYLTATGQIISWAQAAESRYVCVATTHTLMEANDSSSFRHVLNDADLVTPDGMPLVWMLRWKGHRSQNRVYGPQLMLRVLEAAEAARLPIGLYGSTVQVVQLLTKRLHAEFPRMEIAYAFSPPFRALTTPEDNDVIKDIATSGARILFVGLGCPKQERWMAARRGKLRAVKLGVGAAFDFLAGTKKQAPSWMQTAGLEWLFRLGSEPRRLWKRYLYHNPRFAVLAAAELLGLWSRPC